MFSQVGRKMSVLFTYTVSTSWPGYIYWEDVDTVIKMTLIKAKRDPVIVKGRI